MAISTMYGILHIISFKWYTLCGPWVYTYRFTKCGFPTGVKE